MSTATRRFADTHKHRALYTHASRLFVFNDTATTEIYTLSLHDALPISAGHDHELAGGRLAVDLADGRIARQRPGQRRSEEHTSELQSQFHLVCRLLLEKKKNT